MGKLAAALLPIAFVLAIGVSWVGNLLDLIDCDFESNYKCEVVHTVGLIPVVSLFTVWVDNDEEK